FRHGSGQLEQARGAPKQEIKPRKLATLRQPSSADNARSSPIDTGRARTTARGGDQITPSQGSRVGGRPSMAKRVLNSGRARKQIQGTDSQRFVERRSPRPSTRTSPPQHRQILDVSRAGQRFGQRRHLP